MILRASFTQRLEALAPGQWRSFVRDGYRVWSLEAAASLDPWTLPWAEVRKSPEQFDDPKLFKMSSRRTVVRTARTGEPLFVKRALLHGFGERLGLLVRLPKEARELLLALQWRAAGILTPEPVHFAEGIDPVKHRPARWLATRPIPAEAADLKELLRKEGLGHPAWLELARHAAWLHGRDALHGDFRADHVFRTPAGEFWLLDLDGSWFGRPVPRPRRVQALRQLFQSLAASGISAGHGTAFVRAYDPPGRWSLDGAALVAEALARHAAAPRQSRKK
jgi:hypothetical protein